MEQGGTGLDCWNWWQSYADKEGFILLCPSISGPDGGWYQADGETKIFSAINQVRADYHVAPGNSWPVFQPAPNSCRGLPSNILNM